MYLANAALFVSCLASQGMVAPPTVAPGQAPVESSGAPLPADRDLAPADVVQLYDQLFQRLETVDVNSREAVASAFGVAFVMRYESEDLIFWTAEVPASSTFPRLSLDYRERIPGHSRGGSFLSIVFREPAYTRGSAQLRYADLLMTDLPNIHHFPNSRWTYETFRGSNNLALRFDFSDRRLMSAAIFTRRKDLGN